MRAPASAQTRALTGGCAVAHTKLSAAGYAILNGSDPLQVLFRADFPLLLPQTQIERDGLTRNCIFANSLTEAPGTGGDNTFLLVYGAADTAVGAALVTVTWPPP